MTWRAEDGFEVRPRACEECPFVGVDRTDPEFLRKWFAEPDPDQEPRVHCHVDGGSYHPATDDDRGCRGFYAAAERSGAFDPAAQTPAPPGEPQPDPSSTPGTHR